MNDDFSENLPKLTKERKIELFDFYTKQDEFSLQQAKVLIKETLLSYIDSKTSWEEIEYRILLINAHTLCEE